MPVLLVRADWGAYVRAGPLITALRALAGARAHGCLTTIPTREWPLVRDTLILASGDVLTTEHLVAGALLDADWCNHLARQLTERPAPIAAHLHATHAGGLLDAACRPERITGGWLTPLAKTLAAQEPHGLLIAGDAHHPTTTEHT